MMGNGNRGRGMEYNENEIYFDKGVSHFNDDGNMHEKNKVLQGFLQ